MILNFERWSTLSPGRNKSKKILQMIDRKFPYLIHRVNIKYKIITGHLLESFITEK